LIFFLGVFHEIEIGILRDLGEQIDEHQYYIFVANERFRSYEFKFGGYDVNHVLKDAEPELSYEARVHRNVMQGIVDQHLTHLHPDIINDLSQAANDQAQHTSEVHDGAYAVDAFAHATGVTLSQQNRQFVISRALHVWLGFRRPSQDWTLFANYQPTDYMERNKLHALSVAWSAILQHYPIASTPRARQSSVVSALIEKMPFWFGTLVTIVISEVE
jgi:hypothetical protein